MKKILSLLILLIFGLFIFSSGCVTDTTEKITPVPTSTQMATELPTQMPTETQTQNINSKFTIEIIEKIVGSDAAKKMGDSPNFPDAVNSCYLVNVKVKLDTLGDGQLNVKFIPDKYVQIINDNYIYLPSSMSHPPDLPKLSEIYLTESQSISGWLYYKLPIEYALSNTQLTLTLNGNKIESNNVDFSYL